MLNKVKWGILIGTVLTVLKQFLPEVNFPDGLQDAVILIAVFVSQFFIKETQKTIDGLTIKE